VPVFKDDDTSSVILWMYLVDVLYDAQVKLLICADVDVEHLYPQGPFATPFKRSISRMKEMQSEWYWSF
jgi:cell division protein ZapE